MKSWARKGLDLLLAAYPSAELVAFDAQMPNARLRPPRHEPGPWVCVDLRLRSWSTSTDAFAIWKATGAVYTVAGDFLGGEVADDPFLVPEGSPYDGPTVRGPGGAQRPAVRA